MHSDKICVCSLCGVKFSGEKFLKNHVNFCKDVKNPDDRLGANPITVKEEEIDNTELADELATFESILDVEVVFTETFITVDLPKVETPDEVLSHSKCDYAAAQSTQLPEDVEVCKPEAPYKCNICDYTESI